MPDPYLMTPFESEVNALVTGLRIPVGRWFDVDGTALFRVDCQTVDQGDWRAVAHIIVARWCKVVASGQG